VIFVSDEFFDKADKKLASLRAAAQAAKTARDVNLEFAQRVFPEIASIAQSYKKKLLERGIHVEISGNDRGLTFNMMYADGGHRGLMVYPEIESNRIQFHTIYTNDDGRDMTGTDGVSYNESGWKDGIFEQKLQKAIDDFLSYADRHGGIKF
jgi:hypothetical protein